MSQLPTIDAISALFSADQRYQSWLDVEAALALAQAELGMIPTDAADRIAACATFDVLDKTEFQARADANHAPVLALVETLAAACGDTAKPYVHWGGTTQNIIQTARIRQMRIAHAALMQRLGRVFDLLAQMADRGKNMLAAGRSNRRQALPITFGFKVAGWIEEMLRHEQRLRGAESRVFVAQFGGAIGAMHAFDEQGPAVNVAVARRLGLGTVTVPSRASLDHIAEYLQLLALLASTCSKIALEFYTLMTDEIGETLEAIDGAIGSSTMPQKVNSKIGVRVIALAKQLRGLSVTMVEAMQPSHEGDAASNITMYAMIDAATPMAYELLVLFERLLASIQLDEQAMRGNLEATRGMILAEQAMMILAQTMGRQAAHDLVHECAEQTRHNEQDLASTLCQHPDLPSNINKAQIHDALHVENYTGQSKTMARWAIVEAEQAASRLSEVNGCKI